MGGANMVFGRHKAIGAALISGLTLFGMANSAAAETKSYVMNWFYIASYYGGESDCPEGLNPGAHEFYRRDLLRILPVEKVDELLEGFPGEDKGMKWAPYVSVRGNGKDDVYANPETSPDPGLKMIKGKHAWGFNLDGKGAASPNGFEEPDTREKGVNNELYRTLGCIKAYRGGPVGAGEIPSWPEYVWDILRGTMPAWLVTVDKQDNGDATVTFNRATTPIARDASSKTVRSNMTFKIDPDPRGHSVLKGKFKENTFTSTEPGNVTFVADAFGLTPQINMEKARVRLTINPDGSVRGILGGYQPWFDYYWSIASVSYTKEYDMSTDAIAMYYALKKMADADPDPKTGQNRLISAAYVLDMVPAYAVNALQSVSANTSTTTSK